MKPVKTIDKTLMSVFAFFLLVSLLALFMFFIRMIPIEGYGKVYYEGETKSLSWAFIILMVHSLKNPLKCSQHLAHYMIIKNGYQ